MAQTHSLAAIVGKSHRDNINRVFKKLKYPLVYPPGHEKAGEPHPLAGIPLDEAPDPGATFGVPLGPVGGSSISDYGAFFTGDTALVVNEIILNGFPTDIVWEPELTEQKAQQAWNTLEFAAAESDDISGDWSDFISGKGISRKDPEE